MYVSTQSEGEVDEPAPRSSAEHEIIPKNINDRPSSPRIPSSTPPLIVASSRASSGSRSSATTSIKRKKSRPNLFPGEDESDGAQADVDLDYGIVKGNGGGWVNMEGRRRSHAHGTKKLALEGSDLNGRRRVGEDDGRRHSMAT
jgi:hypothetical protein